MASQDSPIIRVGIIGCGEIVQITHIPTFSCLSHLFKIVYLCDISEGALKHCREKIIGNSSPKVTLDPAELCSSDDVDVVLIANSDEYHAAHAILALEHNKHAFVEKPMALNRRDADAVIAAEKASKGKVMVGYMRRYATGTLDALKEIGALDNISYARVRAFVYRGGFQVQSGAYAKRFTDFRPEDLQDREEKGTEQVGQALEKEAGVKVTPDTALMWRFLGGLGSHDLSVMRDAIGMPTQVLGASLGLIFWSVLFQYPGFPVTYEGGLDAIPRFDAHFEVCSTTKSVRVQYDTPYVKGLPITMHIEENADGAYKGSVVRSTYEDAYTLEFKELYEMVAHDKVIVSTAEDFTKDLEIFQMIMKAGYGSTSP